MDSSTKRVSEELDLKLNDEKLCQRIVRIMKGDGPQRVVLTGKSGIGKTRLAMLVSKYSTDIELCYLALRLHLNQKFEDELSLYEYIAYQIEVYDRDDEMVKGMDKEEFLENLKEKIILELKRKMKKSADQMMRAALTKKEIEIMRAKIMLAKKKDKKSSEVEWKQTSSDPEYPTSSVPTHLLLILDDAGEKTTEEYVMKNLGLESFLKDHAPLKILITRRERGKNTTKRDGEAESYAADESQVAEIDEETHSEECDEIYESDAVVKSQGAENDEETQNEECDKIYESDAGVDSQGAQNDGETKSQSEEGHMENESDDMDKLADTTRVGESVPRTGPKGDVEFHDTDVSQDLLKSLDQSIMRSLFQYLINDKSRELLNFLNFEDLCVQIVIHSNHLPASIVVLAKSLNCIARQVLSLSPKQDKVIKEVLSRHEPVSGNSNLQLAYQLLETDDTLNNAITDCFWHSLHFFKHCGCVHYNELITQWILEGYFDPVQSVKKAYKDGHAILMELINRGFLKIQDGDMIVPEMAMNQLTDLRYHGLLGRSQLLFSRVYCGDKIQGLGKITQIDDMIKTVCANERANIYTMLVSGNRLRHETSSEFFKQMAGLQTLVLFDPILKCLTTYLRELCRLRVLVIRNCYQLSDIEKLKVLQKLQVLEVSGASSVVEIADDFFELMTEIQSLNLSGLGIKTLPFNICKLNNLHSLILRDCIRLEDLPDIQELEKLEVLDIRGARNLTTCFGFGENTSKNRFFGSLEKLQFLDFSESKIKRLPVFHKADAAGSADLHSLTRLLLRKCSNLLKLPNLKPLTGLQILDLSGTTSLVDIAAVCLEQKEELKILNLSGTKVTKLPSTFSGLSNLKQLLMRDSSNLKALPNIEGLTSLEVFDVSGCAELHEIEGSFKNMSNLQEVNLSGTRIETLPELPKETRIDCHKLLVLADSRRLIHETWSNVKEALANGSFESTSSFDGVDRIQYTSRKEEESVGEVWGFNSPQNKGLPMEQFYHDQVYMDVYQNTIPFVDTKICQQVLQIQGSNGIKQDKETLAKAEFVAIVDNSAAGLSLIFNDLKSVKGCWLEMCTDIEILFSEEDEERLRHLETLSITNLRPLKSVCISSCKNLKKLSLVCCPDIITLFPASALPTSLEFLRIKFCEKLEKVFEQEVEAPNLHALCLFNLPVLSAINAMLPNLEIYKKDKCPKLEASKEDLRGSDLV